MKKNFVILFMLVSVGAFVYSQKDNNCVSNVLFGEMQMLILQEDSISKSKNEENVRNVIVVDFYKDESTGKCMVKITSSICYYNCCLMGAFEIDNKLIAIYDWRSYCYLSFVNESKFVKKIPGKYKCFEELILPPHRDKERKYEIVNPQTLRFAGQNY